MPFSEEILSRELQRTLRQSVSKLFTEHYRKGSPFESVIMRSHLGSGSVNNVIALGADGNSGGDNGGNKSGNSKEESITAKTIIAANGERIPWVEDQEKKTWEFELQRFVSRIFTELNAHVVPEILALHPQISENQLSKSTRDEVWRQRGVRKF
jgi:hypothetical protein